MKKMDQVIEKICDLIIEEADKDENDSKSTKIKELADALVSIINARASSEKYRISD